MLQDAFFFLHESRIQIVVRYVLGAVAEARNGDEEGEEEEEAEGEEEAWERACVATVQVR